MQVCHKEIFLHLHSLKLMSIPNTTLRRLLIVLLAGGLSVACFSMVCLYRESCSQLCTVIFVIILSVVTLVTCVIAGKQMTIRSLDGGNSCRAGPTQLAGERVRHLSDISESSLCPVCLCSLSDISELYRMDCCSNVLHRSCLTEYVDSILRSQQIIPPCMLCRKSLDLSPFRAKTV